MRLQMVQSLKELYRQPDCWEKTSAPIVRFWTGDGSCWGFPYFERYHNAVRTRGRTAANLLWHRSDCHPGAGDDGVFR
jgi:hypothetical protein